MLVPLLALVLFVCACLYIIYKPPAFIIRQFKRWWPDVLWNVSTSSKVIALTVDDAPSEHTKDILEALEANNSTATFFVIGSQVPGFESSLEDIVRAGHELGNHAMHDEPSRSLSDTMLVDQIQTVEGLLSTAYASVKRPFPPKYFRPGSGFFSSKMRGTLHRLGYRLVLGDIYPHDPQIPYWRVNAKHVMSMAHPGGIIVCHDRREWTAPMLWEVLPKLRQKGYRIVSVSQLLEETRS